MPCCTAWSGVCIGAGRGAREPAQARYNCCLIAAALALWQVLFVLAGPDAIASPLATLQRLIALGYDPRFWTNTAATLAAFAYACVLSRSACHLVVAVSAHKLARDVVEPMLAALYSIPKITLYPVILLIFGLGLSAKVAFGVIHGVFPIALFAIGAIRNLQSLAHAARRASCIYHRARPQPR